MLTLEQKIKLVDLFITHQSIIKTQRAYCKLYSVRKAPGKITIMKLVAKFRSVGSVLDKAHTGRHRTERTAENIELVRLSVLQSPKTSCRRRSQELSLSETTLRRILKNDLKLFPYKIQIKQ